MEPYARGKTTRLVLVDQILDAASEHTGRWVVPKVLCCYQRTAMSANLLDLFEAHAGARERAIVESAFRPERRRRVRTQVHWPVLLLRDGELGVIETTTQNLSSSGFYCYCPEPIPPGESLVCTLKVPAYDPDSDGRALVLECKVRAMRMEPTSDAFFGIAFSIEDYHLVTGGASSELC
jgi:hypothetical protein